MQTMMSGVKIRHFVRQTIHLLRGFVVYNNECYSTSTIASERQWSLFTEPKEVACQDDVTASI